MYALDLTMARWRKSTRSTDNANCIEIAFVAGGWRKSSYSTANADCVEVAFVGPAVGARDSKNTEGPALVFPVNSWAAFLSGASR